MKFLSTAFCILVVALIAGTAGQAQAATIPVEAVRWWGDYFDGDDSVKGSGNRWYRSQPDVPVIDNLNFDGDAVANDSLSYYAFSLDTPLMPTHQRYLNDEPSAVFYGGMVVRYLNRSGQDFLQATIEDSGRNPLGHDERYPHDLPTRATSRAAGDPVPAEGYWGEMTLFMRENTWNFASVWLWRKDGFLNGAADAPLTFGTQSLLSVDVTRNWENVEGGHFVVANGDQFYISQFVLDNGGSRYGKINEVNPLDTLWAMYNPSGLYDIEFDASSAVWLDPMLGEVLFDDIQFAGVYFGNENPVADNVRFVFDNFYMVGELRVADIPLPGAGAMGLVCVGGLALRRHRNR